MPPTGVLPQLRRSDPHVDEVLATERATSPRVMIDARQGRE